MCNSRTADPTKAIEKERLSIYNQRHHRMERLIRESAKGYRNLSAREREVLRLICQGKSNEEIAGLLYRSVNTIRTHRNRIWAKLEIRNAVEAVWIGLAFELV